jgi:hypothetical protein
MPGYVVAPDGDTIVLQKVSKKEANDHIIGLRLFGHTTFFSPYPNLSRVSDEIQRIKQLDAIRDARQAELEAKGEFKPGARAYVARRGTAGR